MNVEIQDNEIKNTAPNYASVWKTGLVGGFIAVTLMFLFPLFLPDPNPFDHERVAQEFINITTYFAIAMVLAITAAMFRVAAWGNRDKHYLRVLATGLVAYQIVVLIYVLNALTNNPFAFNHSETLNVFINAFYINFAIPVVAYFLWLIPGKLPYFRKQMEL